MEVEHNVEFADIPEVLVHRLHKQMYELGKPPRYLEMCELIIIDIDAQSKVQTCVSLVNDLEVAELSQIQRYL